MLYGFYLFKYILFVFVFSPFDADIPKYNSLQLNGNKSRLLCNQKKYHV